MSNRLSGLFFVAVSPALAMAEPVFKPVQVAEHIYQGGWEHYVGGGLASFDCDGDAFPELYAAGGSNPAKLFRNLSQRNDAVRFEEATPDTLALTSVTGAYPLDIDSDGNIDLAVLRAGRNLLLKGDGACGFTPFDTLALDPHEKWTTAFSATWEAGQSLPTLAIGNYVDRTDPAGPFEACDTNELYRPQGEVYGAAFPLDPGFCALSMLFTDWGRNGRADLRVSNDRHYYVRDGEEQLWALEPEPRLYTRQDGWQRFSIWGMGIASRDISGDGLPDVFLTSMADQKFQFLTNREIPAYENAPFDLGVTAHRPYTGDDGRPSTGWHVSFGDVQNDGLDDIFISKGNVEQMPGSAMLDPNNLLVQTTAGKFVEKGDRAGLATLHRSRGAVLADFNRDGLLDVAVVNRRAPLEVYQNVTEVSGNWISVALHQLAPNVQAVGAWIEVATADRTFTREVVVGGGHGGGTSGPQHFGLGAAESARIRVTWPDGGLSDWHSVDANQSLSLDRDGSDIVVTAY